MKKLIILLLVLPVLFAGCSLLSGKDADHNPELPGKIVFSGYDETNILQIFTMNADGSHVKQLTHFDESGATQPSWSRDGRKIVFSSFKDGISIGPYLWSMNADGSNQRYLGYPEPDNEASLPVIGSNARWSPDGTKVVFVMCQGCQVATDNTLWIFDTLTSGLTQLTPHFEDPGYPASDTQPWWSPDGRQIVFSSNRDYVTRDTLRFRTDLYAVNADGTGLKRLTDHGKAGTPVWNTSGTEAEQVIFNVEEGLTGLYKLDLATGESTLLLKTPLRNGKRVYMRAVNQNYLLLFSSETEPATNETTHTWYVYNTETKELNQVLSRTHRSSSPTLGADWVIP